MSSFISPTQMAKIQKKQQDNAAQKKNDGQQTKLYPYWMRVGEEKNITFLDGDLFTTEDGIEIFDVPYALNHTLNIGTQWLSFLCPRNKHGECPACESGQKGSYVCMFTVLVHTPYIAKDGTVYENQRMLFLATSGTREELFVHAKKYKGLRLMNYDVSRSKKDKSPRVGDVFLPMGKKTLSELKKQLGKEANLQPAEYEVDVFIYTPEELQDLGVGHVSAVKSAKPQKPPKVEEDLPELEDQELPW